MRKGAVRAARGGAGPPVTSVGERSCVPQGESVRPVGQRTRPYQTLLDQIFASRTTSPDLGECQIFPAPA